MSFMFKPYPFTDPAAVNHIQMSPELRQAPAVGNMAVAEKLLAAKPRAILLDGYVGAEFSSLIRCIREQLPDKKVVTLNIAETYRTSEELESFLADFLPEDRVTDPILLFGKSHPVTIDALIDPAKLEALASKLNATRSDADLVIVYGQGAVQSSLHSLADCTAFLDVTPMNAVLRLNARRYGALGDAKERSLPYLWRRIYYFD